ncbi:TlpA family protein disulfide reductase [Labilibaculum euxinus]|uniref:Redoxin family protein n=1 Tax=Labilibaculum euxinus TaxID=2686357 RepID=A0A7M4DAL2_9BACT|nr:redoxin family protein [Labilibaculum euxinus]MUP39691.1 redoxin family protein [Labilibaculum euxinus]MVB08896.1 redoxin family protein [Labilibaculum euxinus]
MRYILAISLLFMSFSCSNTTEKGRMINSQKLSHLISQKDKTLVYIWTTWCSGCRKTLAETLPRLQENIDTSEYQILLIAASKNKEEVDSLVSASGLQINSWFLDFTGSDKGVFQNLGIQLLLKKNFPNNDIFTRAIPVFFLADKNGKVLNKKLPHSYDDVMNVIRRNN